VSGRRPSSVARGQAFEGAAERFLQARGLRTVARNYRCRVGEIDLIMREGDTLAFVEVRYRARGARVAPFESITGVKQRRIVLTAQHFLQRHPQYGRQPCRFDAVALEGAPEAPSIDWIKGAFSA
jgi:putative endonuclease